MQSRHKDRRQYFNEQAITTREYVLSFNNLCLIPKMQSLIPCLRRHIGTHEG